MKTFDINIIRNFIPRPCYDPGEYLPEDWSGTALDILNIRECHPEDRLWVVLHREILDVKTLHLIACDFAEMVLPIWEEYGPKGEHFDAPKRAIDTKRRWLKGEYTDAELHAVGEEAWAAAGTAVRAAGSAARGAASAAIWAAFLAADVAAREASREAANAAWGKDPAAIWEDQILVVKKYL